jgi:hypothetical protein
MIDLNKLRSEFEELPEVKQWIDRLIYGDNSEVYISVDETEENNAIATWINGAWFVWKQKAKAQAVPEKKIYLTCEQLYAAANFGAPNKDPELLETELTIAWFDEAHSGSGYYVYISEYPEEGAMKLESKDG